MVISVVRPKVFVVGHNKTGTTSVEILLRRYGYRLGDQATAESFLNDWIERRFDRIVDFCQTADAFQDAPFSYWETYRALDDAYPGSKFILTVRDPQEWFSSTLRWAQRLTGVVGRRPTFAEASAFEYRSPHWFLHSHLNLYDVSPRLLWDRDHYIAAYERHNRDVQRRFASRPDQLLVVDVSEPTAADHIGAFLNVGNRHLAMPHANRTG